MKVLTRNIAETFELLFDKNNNTAYKALQELQKESEEKDRVYPYMDRFWCLAVRPELRLFALSTYLRICQAIPNVPEGFSYFLLYCSFLTLYIAPSNHINIRADGIQLLI